MLERGLVLVAIGFDLYVGGTFTAAGDKVTSGFARWSLVDPASLRPAAFLPLVARGSE